MNLTIKLGILSVANLGIAFLFQWYVLMRLGAGVETDALFAGMTIPQIVLAVISGSLIHVLVPLLAGESEYRQRHDAWAFVALIGGLFGVLAALLYAGAPWWVPLTVPGFNESGQVLTVELTRVQLIGLVFAAINGVQLAAYHARQKFLWADSVPMLATAIALLLLVWALPRFGVFAAAWISILRSGLQTLLLAPGMGRPVRPDLKSFAVREAWTRMKPLLLGTAYYKSDLLVDRFLLSMAGSGSLSLYHFAQQIYGAAGQTLNKAIAVPLVPALSRLHKAGDKVGFQRAYESTLFRVGTIGLLGMLALGLIGRGLLALLMGPGNVSAGHAEELWWIMIWLGGMFVGGAVGQLSSSSFYALGDTSTPTRVGMYSYTFYVPAKLVLFCCLGIMGLALATSVFIIVNFVLQDRLLRSKHF